MQTTWRLVAHKAAVVWLTGLVAVTLAPLAWPGIWSLPLPDPNQISLSPSSQHWLGTDPYGRDVLADLLAGTRSMMTLSLPAAALASFLGTSLGAAAGYWGNTGLRIRRWALRVLLITTLGGLMTAPSFLPLWLLGAAVGIWLAYRPGAGTATTALPLDQAVLALAALVTGIPRLLLVVVLAATQPPSASSLLWLLAFTCWPATARLVRTQVNALKRQAFVEAGYAAGYGPGRLLWRHIGPNLWPTLRAVLPLTVSVCLGLQTTLSFLGLGLPPDEANWGRSLANARLEPTAWWLLAAGVLPLLATTLALNALTSATASQKA